MVMIPGNDAQNYASQFAGAQSQPGQSPQGVGSWWDYLRFLRQPSATILSGTNPLTTAGDQYRAAQQQPAMPQPDAPSAAGPTSPSPVSGDIPFDQFSDPARAADTDQPQSVGSTNDTDQPDMADAPSAEPMNGASSPTMSVGGYYNAIRQGADAASEDTDDGTDLDTMTMQSSQPSPFMQTASVLSDPTLMQKTIDQLIKGSTVGPEDKAIALAQAGFGMAASRSPWTLGALGEGGLSGLQSYNQAKQRAAANAARAATVLGQQQQHGETVRHNQATESNAIDINNQRSLDRQEAIRQRVQVAKDNAAYRDALLGRGKWQLAGTDPDGKPILYDTTSGEQKILDTKLANMKGGAGHGETATAARERLYTAAGFQGQELADRVAGKKAATPAEIERIAIAAGTAAAKNEVSPQRQREAYQKAANDARVTLGGGAPAPAAPPAAAAPAAAATTAPGTAPKPPTGVPSGARYSPSQKAWWWQEGGQWKSRPGS